MRSDLGKSFATRPIKPAAPNSYVTFAQVLAKIVVHNLFKLRNDSHESI